MSIFARLPFVVAVLFASFTVQAQTAIDALIPNLLPIAAKSREAVVNHPTLAAFEVEHTIRDAVSKAVKSLTESPKDISKARSFLTPIEETIGPLREIPLVELHFLLAKLAELEQKLDEQNYHRAFAGALFVTLSRTGNGTSPEAAYKIVMIAEEYDWFGFMQQRWRRKARVSRNIEGKIFDIWTAVSPTGEERDIYFDASAMQDSLRRVFKARGAS